MSIENIASIDEPTLVEQAKSGCSAAFGELYKRHRSSIYRSAFRILRNDQDAQDAVQRSFQRGFTNLNRFREDCAFLTWMTRITINEALMLLRQRRVCTPLPETDNDNVEAAWSIVLADVRPTPEQAAAETELRVVITHAICRLRKNLRTVMLLHDLRGLTSAETARELGLTVSAVKARVFRARRHLRKHLERKYKVSRVSALIATRN
jgi:RNA polymerase sigma-70 factor, ECF subfamily